MTEGLTPPATPLNIKYIDVRGREEHEAILMDPKRCNELGIDRAFEMIVYLKRWGSWLKMDKRS